jgi:hypothetical protein
LNFATLAASLTHTIGWLLGIENVAAIDRARLSLSAPWAEEGVFWVFLLAIAAIVGSLVFYLRWQNKGQPAARGALGLFRGSILALLIVTLADPVLELAVVNRQRPLVCVVFDGTESMAIADELTTGERRAMEDLVGPRGDAPANPSRMDYVQSLLRRKQNNLFTRLASKDVEIEASIFDGNTTSQLRKLNLSPGGKRQLDPVHVASQLSTKGQVTALGSVIHDLAEQSSRRLAAVVLFSDFAHNAGVAPLGGGAQSPASQLAAPLYTVGVGSTEAIDLAIDLQTDPKMKKAERSSIIVKLRQSGLTGQAVNVRVTARKLSGESSSSGGAAIEVGQRTITLKSELETIDFPFTPDDAGRFEFSAAAGKLSGEATEQNNQAERQVNIIDDYLRLMYVAYEPTWEWRFIKEVFHRDKLVGMAGFRTFLSSSDPEVRESNVLFLPTLTPKRSEFFASDVLFLDDMPRAALSDRFCTLAKEYVSNLGGGLVVIAGPRFGPRELYQTSLADMLPVIVDPQAELKASPDLPEFRIRLTPHAARFGFMQLNPDGAEAAASWDNLGKLPWYQPVAMVHPQAEVLAEHPTDLCADGKTPQPLIAIRKYGKGEVVYLGFNEMWRLRKEHGEKYYRQFWSQLIYRLGMSHALGAEKRFVARVDQQQYRSGDKVTLSVEAYDENYEPLSEDGLAARGLAAELSVPGTSGVATQPLTVPMLRKGVFEARIPVFAVGNYSLRVKDPITDKMVEQRFEVTPLSAERRRAVRDEKLQTALAQATGGRSYDLTNVNRLPDDLELTPLEQRQTRNVPLWTTPLWFGVVVMLMLGEWASRKLMRLA